MALKNPKARKTTIKPGSKLANSKTAAKAAPAKPAYKIATQGANKAPLSPGYKAPTKKAAPAASTGSKPKYTIKGGKVTPKQAPKTGSTSKYSLSNKPLQKGPLNPNPKQAAAKAAPAASTSMATKLGSAYGSMKKGAKSLMAGAKNIKGKGRIGAGIAALTAAGTAGVAGYNALKSSKKPAASAASAASNSDLAKQYNRTPSVGTPSSPTVLKKSTTPAAVKKTVGKSKSSKKTTQKPASTASKSSIAKPESFNNFGKQKSSPTVSSPKSLGDMKKTDVSSMIGEMRGGPSSTSSSSTESTSPASKRSTIKEARANIRSARMENRAERKSARMSNRADRLEKRANKLKGKLKYGGSVKAKNGKSFPDLNKDGKITKADILKGRGVIAKKGASVKKMQYGGKAASMKPTMKSGGKMKKCKYGCN
jgi:hypothetical protein